MNKCGNCGHPESNHENLVFRRLGKPDVDMKPCLHISRGIVAGRVAGVNSVCGCKNFEPDDIEKKFVNAVIHGIQVYDTEVDDEDASAMAAIAWSKFVKGNE